ncbi:MAG: hypothetical protein IJB45_03340 [Clostridia bacterium]|nr:hypothetical protein [Clostridia bacterium]
MGAVTIFVIPFFLALVSVINMFGSITGLNVSEVVLPYNPDKGLVWEYDNENDRYIKLKSIEIENGEQVFSFVKRSKSKDMTNGYMMDLVFTDKNGNAETYYAYSKSDYFDKIKILSEDEVAVFEYTITTKKEKWRCEWSMNPDYHYPHKVLYNPDMTGNEITFTVVYELGSDEDDIFWVYFEGDERRGEYFERYGIQLDCSSGQAVLVQEDFLSRDTLYKNS